MSKTFCHPLKLSMNSSPKLSFIIFLVGVIFKLHFFHWILIFFSLELKFKKIPYFNWEKFFLKIYWISNFYGIQFLFYFSVHFFRFHDGILIIKLKDFWECEILDCMGEIMQKVFPFNFRLSAVLLEAQFFVIFEF